MRRAVGTISLRPNAPALRMMERSQMGTNSRQKLTPPALEAVISWCRVIPPMVNTVATRAEMGNA